MNLPAVLDVALGLIVLYLLLSTVCSFVVELLATARWWRKKLLYKTIARLLTGSSDYEAPAKGIFPKLAGTHPNAVLDRFWTHRLASGLAPAGELPSYIEPSTFAAIAIDLAVPGANTGALPSTSEALDTIIRRAATTSNGVPPPPGQAEEYLNEKPKLSPDELRPLRRSILSAFRACGSNRPMIQTVPPIEDLRRSLEKWYNEAMERSTGQYKRRAQRWLLVFGAIAAISFNADTIRAVYVLSTNDNLRNTTAAYAATLAGSTNSVSTDPKVFNLTVTNEIAVAELRTNLVAGMRDLQKLQQLGFPLGWKGDSSLNFAPYSDLNPFVIFLLKFVGLAATALAISLGAPFWFDLLNKLASLRGSGNRVSTEPDTTKTKPSDANEKDAEEAAVPGAAAIALPAPPSPKDFTEAVKDMRPGFQARTAYWMAEAALLAYSGEAVVRAAVGQWGLPFVHFFDKNEACQGFLAATEDKKLAVLAFRGTEQKLQDWIVDSKFQLMASPTKAGNTHEGFTKELTAARAKIDEGLNQLAPDAVLYVTGHSLGAALATLMAALLIEGKSTRGVHSVHTFGSPRVGDQAFVKNYELALGHCTYRLVNAEDLVTRVPPRVIPGKDWKYDHVGQVVFFDSDGRMQLNPGFWERFLNTVINAVEDLKKELQRCLKDHSMEGYVRLLKKQIGRDRAGN